MILSIDETYEWSPIVTLNFEPNYQLQFFPNPTIGQSLFLDMVTEITTLVDVEIYDRLGRTLLKLRVGTDGFRQRLVIDVSDFAGGIYFAKIKIGNSVMSKSFMVGKE